MILELIPVLSLFFLLTSTAGSAMWAARLEHEMRAPPEVQGHASTDDPDAPPPPYVDNPV